jgi:hypothetical protein
MNTTTYFSGPPDSRLDYLLQTIVEDHRKFLLRQSLHQYEEGLYIVKRPASLPPGTMHYGFAAVGRYARFFDPLSNGPVVIHKTNQPGRHCDSFNSYEWERVEKIPDVYLARVLYRARISWNDPYDLFLDNCEHWARYIATGKKESTQVQTFVKVVGFGTLAYLCLRGDH